MVNNLIEVLKSHAHLKFHAKNLQSVSIKTLSEGEDVLHQSCLLYLWRPNWCFHIFYDTGFGSLMMIYENFIFVWMRKNSEIICYLQSDPTVQLWRPPRFPSGIFLVKFRQCMRGYFFLDNRVKEDIKKLVDPPH